MALVMGGAARAVSLHKSILRHFGAGLAALMFVAAALVPVAPAVAATLDDVRTRGHLVCATVDALPGFAQMGENGLWSGFDVDFCRAIATAVLGDPDLVQFRALSGKARFAHLQTGAVDLLARDAEWTLTRDSLYGVHFVATSFYDGQAFLVPESSGIVSAFELKDVRLCMVDNPDQVTAVENFFFQTQSAYSLTLYEATEDLGVAYAAGLCDAVSAPASWLNAMRRGLSDPATQRILPERLSKRPLGPVVREGDDEWFNIVKWVLYALINAEELGVTSVNVDPMLDTKNTAIKHLLGVEGDFGTPLRLKPSWARDVIHAVGNYGEIYARNFGSQTGVALPRGLNSLWTKGGLLYAPPIR